MPDATHGVPVWRNPRPIEHGASESTHYYTDAPAYLVGDREPGTWYPADEAAALEDVREKARRTITCRQGVPAEVQQAQRDLMDAYQRLDAIRNDKEKER